MARLADDAGEVVAVIDRLGGRQRTFAQLAGDAAGLAAQLAHEGVDTGDVVSIQLPNWYEAVVAAVAANSLGAVINPLLPNYRARELCHVFSTAAPKAVFMPATYRGFDHRGAAGRGDRQDRGARRTGSSWMSTPSIRCRSRPSTSRLQGGTSAADVSELIFTSGTEATPKAIMHTEETANFAVRATFSDLGLGARHGRLDAFAGRPFDRLQLRDPRRALSTVRRSCCRTAGMPPTRPSSSTPTGATTRSRRPPSWTISSASASEPECGCRA